MEFAIDFSKGDARTPTMRALEVFLNEHLIGKFHGAGMDSIFIEFVQNPPKKKTFRKRLLYGHMGEIQVPINSLRPETNLEDFKTGLRLVTDGIQLAKEIKLKTSDFRVEELLADLAAAQACAPKSMQELMHYVENAESIRKRNNIKRVRMEHEQRKLTRRPEAVGECIWRRCRRCQERNEQQP